MNQLWPETSKLKSAGLALNIAENAKISESALKMTEYLWELNPGKHAIILRSIMKPLLYVLSLNT